MVDGSWLMVDSSSGRPPQDFLLTKPEVVDLMNHQPSTINQVKISEVRNNPANSTEQHR